jgi:hypothetical protein
MILQINCPGTPHTKYCVHQNKLKLDIGLEKFLASIGRDLRAAESGHIVVDANTSLVTKAILIVL